MVGIYKITDTKNGKVYIGQSKNIGNRRHQHLSSLAAHLHENRKMQSDYNDDAAFFRFDVIEVCKIVELNDREQYWIAYYRSNEAAYGYNMNEGGGYKRHKEKELPRSVMEDIMSKR